FLRLTGQIGDLVVAVEMDVIRLAADRATVEELLGNVRITGSSEQRRKHVDVRNDAVEDRAGLDLTRPTHEARHPPTTLPVAVLLGAERGRGAVRPGVVLRTVVGGVHDDGVVSDAQLIELVEHLADLLVVDDHAIAIGILAALADILFGDVSPEVHGRRVVPEKEWLVGFSLLLHPCDSTVTD